MRALMPLALIAAAAFIYLGSDMTPGRGRCPAPSPRSVEDLFAPCQAAATPDSQPASVRTSLIPELRIAAVYEP
jgi:hypothetical protein